MTQYVLGVDGGGTKTRAAIFDTQSRLHGMGLSGPSNYHDVGETVAQENIAQAVKEAAGSQTPPFAAAFLGMAGVVCHDDHVVIRRIAHNLNLAPVDKIGVDHDIRIALAGGLSGRPGIALIAGTGSSCYGRNGAGQDWQSGGWGHLLGDEGSSHRLGVEAMKAAMQAYDGRAKPTLLLDKVQQHLNLTDMKEIMHRVYVIGLSRAEIGAMAPLVIEAANDGDQAALNLIQHGTQELADCVLAVANQLGMADGACELTLVGGLFRAGDIYVRPFTTAVLDRLPNCHIIPAELPPVLGAGLLSLQLLNITINEDMKRSLKQAAAKIE